MSRSVKHHPFSVYCGGSQNQDKRICNRIIRRSDKVSLRVNGEDAYYLTKTEALDRWSMTQDGTRHYAAYDPIKYERLGWYRWYRWVLAK